MRKDLRRTITVKYLEDNGACEEGVILFWKVFPSGKASVREVFARLLNNKKAYDAEIPLYEELTRENMVDFLLYDCFLLPNKLFESRETERVSDHLNASLAKKMDRKYVNMYLAMLGEKPITPHEKISETLKIAAKKRTKKGYEVSVSFEL